jgi:hypothetical protein
MVAKTQLTQFFAGFFAALTLANLYFAAKQLYIPIFGITAGPTFFITVTAISALVASTLLYIQK